MSVITCAVIVLTVATAAGCGGHTPSASGHSHSAARPSCSQQYENWKHGPAQLAAGRLTATLSQVKAARTSGNGAGLRAAMTELMRDAVALAGHPLPHCADPASLYGAYVNQIYAAAAKARSAAGHRRLLRAAADLLNKTEMTGHRLQAEINQALAKQH